MTLSAVLSLIVLVAATPAGQVVSGAQHASRVWILPFEQPQADSSLEYLQEALPALVAAAISESGGSHVVVERRQLDAVLAEQSLTLEHLTSPDTRLRIGKLLGATVMITGSFARNDQQLLVTMRAVDLESGIIAATAEGTGSTGRPGELIGTLYSRLARDFPRRLPDLAPDQIDEAPFSNLHFMKGLGHYFSARFGQALAEFMMASEDVALAGTSRYWMANAYLAERRYAHAYLELSRLSRAPLKNVREREIEARMRECERHLSSEDVRMIRNLAARGLPQKR